MEEVGQLKYENAAPINYKAKVWNNSDEIYRESYKGRMIEIPARGHIVMDEPVAVDFAGEYSQHEKPLRVERIPNAKIAEKMEEEAVRVNACLCQICGFKAASVQGLKVHTASRHADAKPASPAE